MEDEVSSSGPPPHRRSPRRRVAQRRVGARQDVTDMRQMGSAPARRKYCIITRRREVQNGVYYPGRRSQGGPRFRVRILALGSGGAGRPKRRLSQEGVARSWGLLRLLLRLLLLCAVQVATARASYTSQSIKIFRATRRKTKIVNRARFLMPSRTSIISRLQEGRWRTRRGESEGRRTFFPVGDPI